jgi:hypothetical protein
LSDNATQQLSTTTHLVKRDNTRRFTLAPFLVPDKADAQGDVVSADEIFDAITRVKFSKSLLDKEHLHVDEAIGTPVEIYALPADTIFVKADQPSEELQKKLNELAALQKSIAKDFAAEASLLPAGSGMLGVIWNEATWKDIQEGTLTGLSIEGKGKRIPQEEK